MHVVKSSEEPPSREVPLISLELERAVIGTALANPAWLEESKLHPEWFGQGAHQQIAKVIELVAIDEPVDVTSVAVALKQTGRLEQVGGSAYLGQLMDSTPVCLLENFLAWQDQLRQLWEKRTLLAQARALTAKLETGAVDDHFAAYRESAELVERIKQPEASPLGVWASELGDPNEEPERETWLLHDVIANKPSLPIGRAAMLSAAGGTGKTTVLVQLAVAVALGLEWCGFRVETPGPVVLCCGESDKKLMARHLWRAYNSFELDPEQRWKAAHNILTLPLSGQEVNMIRGGGSDLERTEFLVRFRSRLTKLADQGNFDWSLIVLDPLSRFAGPDTEKDNAAATRFTQAVETLVALPGTPAVVCAHHSSKNSITAGKNDSRGVSGLRDAFRAVMTMTRHVTEDGLVGVLLECDKSNEAPHFQARWLVQGKGAAGGTLRLATDAEAAALHESSHPKKRGRGGSNEARETGTSDADVAAAKETILQILESMHGVARSRSWLEKTRINGYRSVTIRSAFSQLESSKLITIDGPGPTKGTVRMVGFTHQEELPLGDQNDETA